MKKYCVITIFIVFFVAILFFLRNKEFINLKSYKDVRDITEVGYKSYIFKMNNPNTDDAAIIIKNALINEFNQCDCVPSEYPKRTNDGIKLSNNDCDFIGIPGTLANTTFGVTIYLLPNSLLSKVNENTPSIFIGDIIPGKLCESSPFFGLNYERRNVIEKAFTKVGIRGYESYD